jgi:hypothetical protein
MIGAEDESTNPEVEGLLLDSVQGNLVPTKGTEVCDTLAFVQQFSTINISRNQLLAQWGKEHRAADVNKTLSRIQGNSRDNVTSFIYACKNHAFGCTFGHSFRVEISRHEETCPITSVAIFEDLAQKEAVKTFICTEENCSKSFNSVGKRNRHVKDMHGWPKPCPKGCEGSFPTRDLLNKHMEVHSDFKPSKCLVPGCTSQTVFQRASMYRRHIGKVHKIHGKAVDPLMPYKKKEKFVPTKCQVEGCTSEAVWRLPNRYKGHLTNVHEMDEDEVDFYVSLGGC